jgi:hypothetical protein
MEIPVRLRQTRIRQLPDADAFYTVAKSGVIWTIPILVVAENTFDRDLCSAPRET